MNMQMYHAQASLPSALLLTLPLLGSGRQPQGALASLPLELVLAVELFLPPMAGEGNRPSNFFARGSACYKQFAQTTR